MYTLFILILISTLFAACADRTKASSPTNNAPRQSGCSASSSSAHNGQILYVGHASFASGPSFAAVTALDVRDGKKIWQTTIAQTAASPQPEPLQFVNGVIYAIHPVSTDMSAVTALDAKDGHILWQHKTDIQTSILRMVVCNGVMYLSNVTKNGETSIEARQLKDASLLWRYSSPAQIIQPVFTRDAVYILTQALRDRTTQTPHDRTQCYDQYLDLKPTCETASTLTALRTSDGKPLWHSSPYSNSFFSFPPFAIQATDQAVYIVYPVSKNDGHNGTIWKSAVDALRAGDGSVLWQHAQVDVSNASPNTAVFNGILYLTGLDQLAAISVRDGKQLWTYFGAYSVYSVELNAGNGVIYTKGKKFCALEASSGKTQWCIDHPDTGFLTVASETAVYSSLGFEGTVYALQQRNGKEIWHYTPEADHQTFGMALD